MRSGSDERVAQPPWTHDFGPGFILTSFVPLRGQLKLFNASVVAATWGRLFFGYFLLAKQKKVTPPGGYKLKFITYTRQISARGQNKQMSGMTGCGRG